MANQAAKVVFLKFYIENHKAGSGDDLKVTAPLYTHSPRDRQIYTLHFFAVLP